MSIDLIEVQVPGPPGPPGSSTPFYGQASRTTTGTIDIAAQSVYQPTGLTTTFDSANASGVAYATANSFGLKNVSGLTKLFRVYGSIDAKASNNETLGIKLAKNGVAVDETECRAFGASGQEAKLVTSWMISLADQDEVSLLIANHSSTVDITFGRGRILMSAVN